MHFDLSAYPWDNRPNRFIKSMVILATLCSFGPPAHSLDIYQWVDEHGKTHMADVVPEKYRATAKLVSYRKDNVGNADRQNAQVNAAKNKLPIAPKPVDAVTQPTTSNTPKPVEPTQNLTCTQKWDAYHRSQECFAPYMIRFSGGSTIKPEAYLNCQDVKTPAMECEYDKRPSKN